MIPRNNANNTLEQLNGLIQDDVYLEANNLNDFISLLDTLQENEINNLIEEFKNALFSDCKANVAKTLIDYVEQLKQNSNLHQKSTSSEVKYFNITDSIATEVITFIQWRDAIKPNERLNREDFDLLVLTLDQAQLDLKLLDTLVMMFKEFHKHGKSIVMNQLCVFVPDHFSIIKDQLTSNLNNLVKKLPNTKHPAKNLPEDTVSSNRTPEIIMTSEVSEIENHGNGSNTSELAIEKEIECYLELINKQKFSEEEAQREILLKLVLQKRKDLANELCDTYFFSKRILKELTQDNNLSQLDPVPTATVQNSVAEETTQQGVMPNVQEEFINHLKNQNEDRELIIATAIQLVGHLQEYESKSEEIARYLVICELIRYKKINLAMILCDEPNNYSPNLPVVLETEGNYLSPLELLLNDDKISLYNFRQWLTLPNLGYSIKRINLDSNFRYISQKFLSFLTVIKNEAEYYFNSDPEIIKALTIMLTSNNVDYTECLNWFSLLMHFQIPFDSKCLESCAKSLFDHNNQEVHQKYLDFMIYFNIPRFSDITIDGLNQQFEQERSNKKIDKDVKYQALTNILVQLGIYDFDVLVSFNGKLGNLKPRESFYNNSNHVWWCAQQLQRLLNQNLYVFTAHRSGTKNRGAKSEQFIKDLINDLRKRNKQVVYMGRSGFFGKTNRSTVSKASSGPLPETKL